MRCCVTQYVLSVLIILPSGWQKFEPLIHISDKMFYVKWKTLNSFPFEKLYVRDASCNFQSLSMVGTARTLTKHSDDAKKQYWQMAHPSSTAPSYSVSILYCPETWESLVQFVLHLHSPRMMSAGMRPLLCQIGPTNTPHECPIVFFHLTHSCFIEVQSETGHRSRAYVIAK